MKAKNKKGKIISRRVMLPILGGSLFIPFVGFGKTVEEIAEEEEYESLLKPDGTTVKVKRSALKNSKVVKKNVSNKSLLKWLGKNH